MSELTKSELKKLRESEFYKFETKSDFRTIRKCFEVSKQLYECLKYFDKRASRFSLVPQNVQFYNLNRSRVHPDEYFHFQFQNVRISLFKSKNDFFVGVDGPWIPRTLGKDYCIHELTNFHKYMPTNLFEEAMDIYLKAISEFIASRFDSRGLF